MIGCTPANELIKAAKSVSNQVGMTMIVLCVIERDSHDCASRHFGNCAACRQMSSKSALGDHNMQGRLRQHPHWAGYAQKKDRKKSLQRDLSQRVTVALYEAASSADHSAPPITPFLVYSVALGITERFTYFSLEHPPRGLTAAVTVIVTAQIHQRVI